MTPKSNLTEQLRSFGRRWEQITSIPESPRSMLSIIEHSLGRQRKSEVYVNKMLAYFLDPNEPHGMGSEFLRAFLDGLPEACGFDEDTLDLEDITVADQVPVGEGVADLVIEAPREWFLLIELEFHATGSETIAFHGADEVGKTPKEDYQSGNYYLFLHHRQKPPARSKEFTNWAWHEFVRDVLRQFHLKHSPRYPQRTSVQLRELIDDLEEITAMAEQQPQKREKIQLYLDYQDAIRDVTKTFEKRWHEFTKEWEPLLQSALEHDGIDTAPWTFHTNSNDWGILFKRGWYTHVETLQSLTTRAADLKDARIIFHHRLQRNRDRAIRERKLKFYFRHCGSNDKAFSSALNKRFGARAEEITELLPASARITGNQRNKIEATYDIRTEGHDDFFSAYIDALKRAFIDFVQQNDPLIQVLEEVYRGAFVEIYGAVPHTRR